MNHYDLEVERRQYREMQRNREAHGLELTDAGLAVHFALELFRCAEEGRPPTEAARRWALENGAGRR